MIRQFVLFLCFLSITAISALAQEIKATVSIQTPNLQTVDPRVFKTLENDLRDFLNGRKWTDDVYKLEERIQCSFVLTITSELSPSSFSAQLTVQSNRPVYNTTYNSVLFNYMEKSITFDYTEFQPLDFNENAFNSDLTSLFAYYIYVILGFDYDTFAPFGGTPYFSKAQQIVANAQTKSKDKSWQPQGTNRNRYWLVENLLNNKFRPFRQAYYNYHRLGLDKMYENINEARLSLTATLPLFEKINTDNPNTMLPDLFVTAKSSELVQIFSDGTVPPTDKMKAINVLSNIDPANREKYEAINKAGSVGNNPSDAMQKMIDAKMGKQ